MVRISRMSVGPDIKWDLDKATRFTKAASTHLKELGLLPLEEGNPNDAVAIIDSYVRTVDGLKPDSPKRQEVEANAAEVVGYLQRKYAQSSEETEGGHTDNEIREISRSMARIAAEEIVRLECDDPLAELVNDGNVSELIKRLYDDGHFGSEAYIALVVATGRVEGLKSESASVRTVTQRGREYIAADMQKSPKPAVLLRRIIGSREDRDPISWQQFVNEFGDRFESSDESARLLELAVAKELRELYPARLHDLLPHSRNNPEAA